MGTLTFRDLYLRQMQDILSAQTQLVLAVPAIMEASTHPELRERLADHLGQTRAHVRQIESLIEDLGEGTSGEKCEAMHGLIREGARIIRAGYPASVRDSGLIAVMQRIEHYEISAYGSARSFAALMGDQRAADLLNESLQEEKQADELLNDLALNVVNPRAMEETIPQHAGQAVADS